MMRCVCAWGFAGGGVFEAGGGGGEEEQLQTIFPLFRFDVGNMEQGYHKIPLSTSDWGACLLLSDKFFFLSLGPENCINPSRRNECKMVGGKTLSFFFSK